MVLVPTFSFAARRAEQEAAEGSKGDDVICFILGVRTCSYLLAGSNQRQAQPNRLSLLVRSTYLVSSCPVRKRDKRRILVFLTRLLATMHKDYRNQRNRQTNYSIFPSLLILVCGRVQQWTNQFLETVHDKDGTDHSPITKGGTAVESRNSTFSIEFLCRL